MSQSIDENRAQLISSLRQRAEELTWLSRIAIVLTSELDLQRLLQMVTDVARKITTAEMERLPSSFWGWNHLQKRVTQAIIQYLILSDMGCNTPPTTIPYRPGI